LEKIDKDIARIKQWRF